MNKKDGKLISHRKKEKKLESQKKEGENEGGRGRSGIADKEMEDKETYEEDATKGFIQVGLEDEEDGDDNDDDDDDCKVKDIQLMKRNTQGLVGIKLSELQEYGYFGDEEITEKNPTRQFTVICTSAHAEVLVIQKKDFELRVLSDAVSCQFFVNKSQLRGKRHNNSLDSSESQLKVFKDYVCQTSSYFCRAELDIKTKPRCMSMREAVIAKTLVKGNYFESEFAKKEQQQRVANDQQNEDLRGIQIHDWMQKERENQQKEKGITEQQQVRQPKEVTVYEKHNTINVNNTDENTLIDRIRARTPDGLLVSLQRHYTLDDELIPYQIKEAMQNSIISRANSIISVSHKSQRLHSNSSLQASSSLMETPKNTNNSLDTPQSASPSLSAGGFWLPKRKAVSSAASAPAHSAKRSIPGTISKKKEWVSKYTASFQENLRKNLHEKFKDSSKLNAAAIKKHLKQSAISSIPNDHLAQPPPALANKKPVMMAPEMDQKLKLFKRIAIQTLNTSKRNASGPNVRVDIKDIAEELQRKIKEKKINDIKEKFMDIMNTRKKKGGEEERKRLDGIVGGTNEESQVELVKSKFMSVLAGKKEKMKKKQIGEEIPEDRTAEGCEEYDQIKEQLQPVKCIELQNSEESQYMSTLPDSPGIDGLDSVREDSLKVNEEGNTVEEGEDWQLRSNMSRNNNSSNDGSFDLFSPCLLRSSVSQIYNVSSGGGSDDNSNESSQSQQPSEDPQMKQPIKPADSPKSLWHRCRKISQSSMFSPKSQQLREKLSKQQQIPQLSPSKSRKTTVSLHASSKNKVDSGYYDGMLIRKHLENKEFFCLLKGGSDIESIKASDNEGLKRAFLSCDSNPFIIANNRNGEYDALKEDKTTTKEQVYKEYPSAQGRRPATAMVKPQHSRSQSLHNPVQQQQQLQHAQMNYPYNRTFLHSRSSFKGHAVPLYKFQVAQIEEHQQKRGKQQQQQHHHRKTMSQNNMNIVKHITIHSVFSK